MGDLLDMQEYRTRQRKLRRLAEDAKKASTHSAWAYGPQGLSGQPGEPGDGAEANPVRSPDTDLKKAHAVAQVDAYINDVADRAAQGQAWSQFRLAALQCTDMEPGNAIKVMHEAFPDMSPEKFETWLEHATEEFLKYSNIIDKEL